MSEMLRNASFALAALLLSCSIAAAQNHPLAAAHRGCHFKGLVPENSVDGVRMAARFGYEAIECDVKYTSDKAMVVMHDRTINRTMRNASDYSEIQGDVKVAETSFDDLRKNYVLASSDPGYRKPIPTLEEILNVCKECGITPILHSAVPESYLLAQKMMGDNWVCFNSNLSAIRQARGFSKCLILWDPGKSGSEDPISEFKPLGGRLGFSSMKHDVFDSAYISRVRAAGLEFQSSIWRTPHEMRAIHDGASIILSDWYWNPGKKGFKAAESYRKGREKLAAGESIDIEFSKNEFSALTFDMDFKGRVRITVNGKRVYEAAHDDFDSEHVGFRMHDCRPSLKIEAIDDSIIKSYAADLYVM